MESRLSLGTGTMIKCGWRDCPSLFSSEGDMLEHLFVRHVRNMHVNIEFLEGNSILLRLLPPQESRPPSTPSPNLPPSPTSSVGSNRTSGKVSARNRKSLFFCYFRSFSKNCSCRTFEEFHTPSESRLGVQSIPIQKQISLGSTATSKRSLSSDQIQSEAKKQKMEVNSPSQNPHRTVTSSTVQPVEKHDFDIPINYSTCSDAIQICQLMMDHIGKLPEKSFENPTNLEFCLPCLRFKGPCEVKHGPLAERLKNTWLTRYKEKMEEKGQGVTKALLLEQLGKLKKKYMNSGTVARKSNPSTNLV
ncbi:hypothetical protein CAEBREN_02410 [Caenorhabditis brenneri]|uniref:C2H2-type domain-containing protein n=1 Tax=Caenorhabditis brenneri TaxID=135651 RepID=G0NDK3_CAEBE|nr:hypothetical protein CAEBREN_02410 [Caenorhabditis brenneri]